MNKSYRAEQLDQLYDEGYFHGQGSGYSKEGYEHEHEDWTPLLNLIANRLGQKIRWLDLGCAYGYLIEQAQQAEITAFGLDISTYALKRLPSVSDQKVCGVCESLPFQKKSLDVVSLFDLIEHTSSPGDILAEIARVLKPTGILLLSTPDPIYFKRDEPTHIHERPPSYWVDLLKRAGFQVSIRFGRQFYEIEIIASPQKTEVWSELQKDFLNQRSSINEVIINQDENILLVPRTYDLSKTIQDDSFFYVLNTSKDPIQINLSIYSTSDFHPDLFLDNLKLRYSGSRTTKNSHHHQWNPVTIKPGGAILQIKTNGESLDINRLELKSTQVNREKFLKALSFDHYQRYQYIADIINTTWKREVSILDVGGAYGLLPLFVPNHQCTVLDIVWEDHPTAIQYEGQTLPCDDGSFDVVISVDTLEHLPNEKRPQFINELCRVTKETCILCCPFAEPHVTETETVLREFITTQLNGNDRFLNEHALYSLPERTEIFNFLKQNGFSIVELPNGYLPRWLSMQLVMYTMGMAPELSDGKANLNALYNSHYYSMDNRYPSYRIVAVAQRGDISHTFKQILQSLMSSREKAPPTIMWNVASLIVALSHYGLLREKDSYLEAQGTRLERLLDHTVFLEKDRQQLSDHARNLDEQAQESRQQIASLQKHCDNLLKQFSEQKRDSHNLLELSQTLKEQYSNLQQHVNNLDQFQKERDNHLTRLQEHISNLEKREEEQYRHADNQQKLVSQLQDHLESLSNHIANVEKDAESWRIHAQNLENNSSQWRDHTHHLENSLRELNTHIKNLDINTNAWKTHAENLQTNADEWKKHAQNIEPILNNQQSHIQNLESLLSSLQTHANNLENLLASQQSHSNNLEALVTEKDKHIHNLDTANKTFKHHLQNLLFNVFHLEHSTTVSYIPDTNIDEYVNTALTFLTNMDKEQITLLEFMDLPNNQPRLETFKQLKSELENLKGDKDSLQLQLNRIQQSFFYRIYKKLAALRLVPKIDEEPPIE